MSNMKQVILGLNALGRVSASVDGFEGPSLSAGIERTASVNRSGKVSRLSVNLKDKINVAPPTLDPIQAAEQERREKAFREAKAAAGAQTDVEPTAGSKYRAVAKSAIRAGFELDSDKLGSVKVGEVIEVIEARKNADGVFRVKFAQGWASLKGRSGKVLLEAAPDDATVSSIVLQ